MFRPVDCERFADKSVISIFFIFEFVYFCIRFNTVLRQDMAFFDRNKVGEIVSRLSTDAYIVGYSVTSNLGEGTRALFTTLGSVAMMVGDLFKN